MDIEIIPAVMPESLEELREKAALLRGVVKTVQVDVMDGKFVSSLDWPMQPQDKEGFLKIIEGTDALPFWKELDYEADLMIHNPEESISEWVNAGFHRIIIHIESTTKAVQIFDEWSGPVEMGIALNVDTPNDVLFPLLDEGKVKFVQFMGIAQIGYQGQPFDERVIHKITSLRKLYPSVIISVDGAVNSDTIPRLVSAGVSRLAMGSAFWKYEDLKVGMGEIQKLVKSAV